MNDAVTTTPGGGPVKITITLNVPITHGDEVLTELVLTEPSAEGLMAMDQANGDMAKTIATICACTALPPSVIKQLRARDLRQIGDKVAELMGEESPATGERLLPGWPLTSTGRRPN
jgi:hypothetical protein